MTIERALRLMAGTLILFSMLMAYFLSPWWHLLTLFVSLNLFQSGFTGWCPAMWMLERLGVPYGPCQPDGTFQKVELKDQ